MKFEAPLTHHSQPISDWTLDDETIKQAALADQEDKKLRALQKEVEKKQALDEKELDKHKAKTAKEIVALKNDKLKLQDK